MRRPRYYNERDRPTALNEETRLLVAARDQDREQSIKRRREQLMQHERQEADGAMSTYRRMKIGNDACQRYLAGIFNNRFSQGRDAGLPETDLARNAS